MTPVVPSPNFRRLRTLIIGALGVRVAFACATPAWQSADEYPHYWVASSIAADNRYPGGSPEFPCYEAYQAPLYYGVLAGVIRVAGLPVLPYSETPERPPLALVILRLVSALLGVSVVAATWWGIRGIFPGDPNIAYFSAAFAAVLPTFVGLSASLNNDVLVVFFSSLFLGLVLQPSIRWTSGSCLGGGFLLGAAIASKLTGCLLLPVLAYRLLAARKDGLRDFSRLALLFVPGIMVGAGLLAARNVAVYGDLLVITPGVQRGFAVTGPQLVHAIRNMGWSFWLAFGRTYDIHLSSPVYLLVVGAMSLAAVGGWWRLWSQKGVRSIAFLLAVPIGLAAAASLAFTLSYPPGTQTSWGKNLYPLLPLCSACAAFGWANLVPGRPRLVPWMAVAVLLAGSLWGLVSVAAYVHWY